MSPNSEPKPLRERLQYKGLAMLTGIAVAATVVAPVTAEAASHKHVSHHHKQAAIPSHSGIEGGTSAPETSGQDAGPTSSETAGSTGAAGPAPEGDLGTPGGTEAPVTPGPQGGVQAPA